MDFIGNKHAEAFLPRISQKNLGNSRYFAKLVLTSEAVSKDSWLKNYSRRSLLYGLKNNGKDLLIQQTSGKLAG